MTRQHVLLPILSVAMVLILASCETPLTDSHVLGDVETIATLASSASLQEAPLTGRCETTFMPHPTQPLPPLVRQIDEGICRLSHLGNTSFHSVKDINFATGTQITTELILTAANGDVLRATGSGTSAPSAPGTIGFTATLTFVGGTGRFERASGEVNVIGEAALATRTAAFEFVSGRINYDASDRGRR